MSMCATCTDARALSAHLVLERLEGALLSLELESRGAVRHHVVLGSRPRSLQEQHVLLTAEPSLRPQKWISKYDF